MTIDESKIDPQLLRAAQEHLGTEDAESTIVEALRLVAREALFDYFRNLDDEQRQAIERAHAA